MNFKAFSLFIALTVCLSAAQAQIDQEPLLGPYKLDPITIAASDCETITISDKHLNRSSRLFLHSLNPQEMQIFKERRVVLLQEVASLIRRYINQFGLYEKARQCFFKNESRALEFARDAAVEITNVLVGGDMINSDIELPVYADRLSHHDIGILVFKDILEMADRKMIEKAKAITSCHQFGFCTGLGLKAALGFKRLFVGFGGFLSRDAVRSFEKNAKWSTHYNVDIEVGTHAHTPTISVFFGLKAFLHFDKAPHIEITEFETTYYPGFPVTIQGPNTSGVGATLGFSGIPIISNIAFFKSQAIRVQPTRKAIIDGCETALGIIKQKIKPEEAPVVSPKNQYPPDDIG